MLWPVILLALIINTVSPVNFTLGLGDVSIFHMADQDQFSGKDQTPEVFGSDDVEIFPVAYVDLNGDKLTDIVAVTRDRTALDIFLAFNQPPYLRRAMDSNNITDEDGEKRIISVRPGDFTGDGVVDLMVTLRKDSITYEEFVLGNETAVEVIFCQLKFGSDTYDVSMKCPGDGKGRKLDQLVVQEPMVLDVNGDMALDLIGEIWILDSNSSDPNKELPFWRKQRTVWYSGNTESTFEWQIETFNLYPDPDTDEKFMRDMINISTNAYADLNGDDIPELTVISEDASLNRSKSIYFIETFDIMKNTLETTLFRFKMAPQMIQIDEPINETKVLGQPMIMDFERSGNLELLLPYCSDFKCKHFGIYVVDEQGTTTRLPLQSFAYDGLEWGFIPPERPPKPPTKSPTNHSTTTTPSPLPPEYFKMESFYTRALSFRVGDYNFDGFPDLLAVLQTISTPGQLRMTRAVILENVPCASNPCIYNRTFAANFEMLKSYTNVISASFYDIKDNGALDVFLVKHHQDEPSQAGQTQKFTIRAFENEMNFDSSFLKFQVLTGQRCDKCKDSGGLPYGNVLPGAKIRYTSLNTKGIEESGVMAQAYRTSHVPLDLPCGVFGIGHSPNFIETFSVSIAPNAEKKYKRDWLQIVPNSQVVVVPWPIDQPSKWTMKLFLTPSDAVLKTFGVLVGICAVLATFVAALEFKERREDRKQRQSEASRLFM